MGMTRNIPPGAIGYKTREEAIEAWNKIKADKKAAKAAESAQRKADRAAKVKAEREARQVAELERARQAADRGQGGVAAVVRALKPGESYVACQYKSTTQVSALLARLWIKNAQRYTSEVVRDLVTGDGVIGVRITRIA